MSWNESDINKLMFKPISRLSSYALRFIADESRETFGIFRMTEQSSAEQKNSFNCWINTRSVCHVFSATEISTLNIISVAWAEFVIC